MNTFSISFESYDHLDKRISDLIRVADDLEGQTSLSMSTALEADRIVPHKEILSVYFGNDPKVIKHQLATESIKDSIVDAVKKAYQHIAEMLKKFVGWIVDSIKKAYAASKANVGQIKTAIAECVSELSDIDELTHSIADGLSMEDASHYNQNGGVYIGDVFEKFRTSLNETEVDFLTSGQRYKIVKDIVHEFSMGNYPEFISGITNDIRFWIEESLEEARNTGRDPDVVKNFSFKQNKKLTDIKQRYYHSITGIDEMDRQCSNHLPKGDYAHLKLFQNKPSMLFPHLQHIWDSIKFEKIDESDKRLISNLDKIRKQYESDAKTISAALVNKDHSWPAEDEVLRMAQAANRNILRYISVLIKIGSFIKHSANTAYQATMKSFTYISKLLNAISRSSTADKDKLNRCLDVIHEKLRSLNDMSALV